MSEAYRQWLNGKIGSECTAAMKKNGFDAHFVETVDQARELVLQLCDGYESFGCGGSSTTRRLGIVDHLVQVGKTVYDHLAEGFDLEAGTQCRRDQLRSDCFLCSANAIAMTGEIVNVDGVGNRTSAMAFGPLKVIVVAGVNKVVPDLASALARVQQTAAPMRAKSLGMNTPCAKTGICTDCHTPQRICRITTILHRQPMLTDISVVLVNESLGY